jgi:SH3-like domain-containing protein
MSLKLTLAASLAALTLFAAGSALAATGEATGDVNIREEADTDADILGVMSEGDEADFEDCEDGWCALADGEGYVSAAFLDFGGGDDEDEDEDYDDVDVEVDFDHGDLEFEIEL